MKAQLESIRATAVAEIAAAETSLEEIRIKYLGKKGALTAILRGMGGLSAEERPVIGALANEVRGKIEAAIEEKLGAVKAAELDKIVDFQLGAPVLYVTVSLLRFIYNRANLFLRQVTVLAQISHSYAIIHD